MTNAPDDLGPSLPRELFNENGEAFGAELETLLDSFEQLDNDGRKNYRDKNAEFVATHSATRILIVAVPWGAAVELVDTVTLRFRVRHSEFGGDGDLGIEKLDWTYLGDG
jgi:hypothetical protein